MDLLNYDDEMECPTCKGVGRIKKRDKRLSDLTLPELKAIMIECFEMLKQHELNTSMIEYNKLWKKEESEDVFIKDGVPVPKEW